MQTSSLLRKCLAVGIILLFIGTAIIPSSGQKIDKQSLLGSRGNTLYVGGSGPENYTRIQDAVDNASDGDTVFVYRGVYYENIIVNKSISLMGESRSNTFIWNMKPDNSETILISSDNVSVSRFSIFNSSCSRPGINILSSRHSLVSECNFFLNYDGIWVQNSEDITISKCYLEENRIMLYNTSYSYIENCSFHRSGLDLDESESNLIANCVFQDSYDGITMNDYSSRNRIINCSINDAVYSGIDIYDSNSEQVKHCEIINSQIGVCLSNSSENEVSENTIESDYPRTNNQGLVIWFSKNNTVTNNIIHEEKDGIILIGDNNTIILQNIISNNTQIGLNLSESTCTSIQSNNFEDNRQDAYFIDSNNSTWRSNYWGRIRFLPKPIFGILHVKVGKQIRIPYIWMNFDWRPAKKPYDIPGMR